MKKKKRPARSGWIRALLLVIFIAAGIYVYHATDYARYITRDALSSTIDSVRLFVTPFGVLGPVVFAVAGCLAITVNIPTVIVICFAVLLFGGVGGAVVSAASLYMATTLIYFVAQLLGRDFVNWAFGERLGKIQDRLHTEGLMTVVYVRLLFFMLPPVNWLLSLTTVRYKELFLGTLLGTAPMIVLCAWLSDRLIEAVRAGHSLNPLKTRELLLPLALGVALFAVLRIIDRRRTKVPAATERKSSSL